MHAGRLGMPGMGLYYFFHPSFDVSLDSALDECSVAIYFFLMLAAPCANQAGLQLWCYRQPATYPSYSFVFARETAVIPTTFGYRSRDKRWLLFRCSAIVAATVVDAIVVIVVVQRSASAIRVFRPLSHPILLAVLLSQIHCFLSLFSFHRTSCRSR